MSPDDGKVFPYSFTKEAYEEYRRESPPLKDFSKQDQPQSFAWIHPPHWILYPPPLPEYVVEGLIPRRQVTLFTGHGAAGKSTVCLNLCAAHALDRSWLNYPLTAGPSIFLDAEDEEGVIYQRLLAICQNYGCTLADLADLYVLSLVGQDPVLATFDRLGRIIPTALLAWLKQQAQTIKPIQIVIASSANVFAGNEVDRAQVTAFINLLTGLAHDANGSVILIAHPPKNTGADYSGSTAWHNSVRAQMTLQTVKSVEDQDNSDLRLLEFTKNQYGKVAAAVSLRWRNGLFLPLESISEHDRAAADAKDDAFFRDALSRSRAAGRHVSDKPRANNYAPYVFSLEPEATVRKKLETAMRRLFAAGEIRLAPYGPKSDGTEEIVFTV